MVRETVIEIRYHMLMASCRVVGVLPDWFTYGILGRLLYFILYRVARYRVKVVRNNLLHAFPEMSEQERRTIERDYYKHLADVFIDTIDMSNMSAEEMRRRLTVDDIDNQLRVTSGKSWIAMMAHYGSWEYFGAYQLYDPASQVVGVYHPLHDPAFDKYYRKIRSRFGVLPIARNDMVRFCLKHRNGYNGHPIIFGLIADQRPPQEDHKLCCEFLNRPTHFFMGSDWLARRFGLPVYFMHVDKTGHSRYHIWFEELYNGTDPIEEGVITHRYAQTLEKMIRRKPYLWMWSHRRWKSADMLEAQLKASASQLSEEPAVMSDAECGVPAAGQNDTADK